MNVCVNIHFQEFALRLANELEIDVNVTDQSAEDGLADTVKPRLEQAGADCEKISLPMMKM